MAELTQIFGYDRSQKQSKRLEKVYPSTRTILTQLKSSSIFTLTNAKLSKNSANNNYARTVLHVKFKGRVRSPNRARLRRVDSSSPGSFLNAVSRIPQSNHMFLTSRYLATPYCHIYTHRAEC